LELPAPRTRGQLLRVLGLGFGLASIVGGVIGAGILRQPGVVAGAIGDPVVIISLWVVGGLMAAVNAFVVVELGSALPRAGGPYALVTRVLGPRMGATIGWVDWFNGMSTIAFLAVAFAEFLQRAGLLADRSLGLVAVAIILAALVINWRGTRFTGAALTLLLGAKGVALAAIMVALFLAPAVEPGPPEGVTPMALGFAAFAIAMRAIYNTYVGYLAPLYVGEEMVAPERNVARSVFGGLAVVATLYVLINIALLRILTIEEMAASPLALAEGAVKAFGANGGLAVAAFGALSVAASVNLRLMTQSRAAFAMARDTALPRQLAWVSSAGAPRVALATTAAGALLLASSGAYLALVAMNTPLRIMIELALIASLVRLRRIEPDLPRPWKMPLFPLPAILALVSGSLLLIAVVLEDPVNSGIAIGAVALASAFIWRRR
jgi:APA family basic amino acid/polyamine antiporter